MNPIGGIYRFPLMPNFKVEPGPLAATARPDFGDDVTLADKLSFAAKQAMVLCVKGKPSFSMVYDNDEALAA